jgi:hypothetical protein
VVGAIRFSRGVGGVLRKFQGSQLWANWNPRRRSDAIDDFLRAKRPDNAIVVKANRRDNPWFPDTLDEERRTDLKLYPERYAHSGKATTPGLLRARTLRAI